MLFAQVADGYQLFFGKDLAYRVVPRPVRLLSNCSMQDIRRIQDLRTAITYLVFCLELMCSERTIIFVFSLMVASKLCIFIVHSEAGQVSVAPRSGGCSGTYLTFPPAISIFEMYLEFRQPIIHP